MADEVAAQPPVGQQSQPTSNQGQVTQQQGQQPQQPNQGQQQSTLFQKSDQPEQKTNPAIDRYTGHFEYNKIYYFRYTPIDMNKVHIYDQMPQVIFMDIRGSTALGINLHWIPGALRHKFVQVIVEMRNKCINESLFRLWYRTIKYNPPLHFALGAIRRYYISHCTNIKIVSVWETIQYTQILYKARYLQRSTYNPAAHTVQKGKRQYPR